MCVFTNLQGFFQSVTHTFLFDFVDVPRKTSEQATSTNSRRPVPINYSDVCHKSDPILSPITFDGFHEGKMSLPKLVGSRNVTPASSKSDKLWCTSSIRVRKPLRTEPLKVRKYVTIVVMVKKIMCRNIM